MARTPTPAAATAPVDDEAVGTDAQPIAEDAAAPAAADEAAPVEVAETPAAPAEEQPELDAAQSDTAPITPTEPPADPEAAAPAEPAAPAVNPNMARLHGTPKSSATVAGVTYNANEDGVIEVPIFAIETLLSHGFRVSA